MLYYGILSTPENRGYIRKIDEIGELLTIVWVGWCINIGLFLYFCMYLKKMLIKNFLKSPTNIILPSTYIITDLKGDIDSNIIVGNFNVPLTSVDRSFRWKVNKETAAFSDTLVQITLGARYRTIHPKETRYTFLSAQGVFSRIHCMIGHKSW